MGRTVFTYEELQIRVLEQLTIVSDIIVERVTAAESGDVLRIRLDEYTMEDFMRKSKQIERHDGGAMDSHEK